MTRAAPRGPAPIPTDRPRAAALRVLQQLTAADAPVTIGVLTDALGGHPNTVRAQLAHLVEQGFATEVALPAGGRGRPALAFAPTLAGRQVSLAEPGRDDHAALVEAVAEQLAASPDPLSAAHDLGRAWGRRIAPAAGGTPGTDGSPAADGAPGTDGRLFETLGAQGFTPERTTVGIALRTCPLLDSALRHPEVVCGIHQGLIDALSAEPLELVPFAAPGFCLVRAGEPRPSGGA